ncbi:hypothetical protein ES703_117960 [subsurface metagenome]
METLSGRQEPEHSPSSLDIETTSARRRYKRMYHRVMSGLERDGSVRLLTLTTAREAQSRPFQRDFRKLIMRLQRRNLVASYIRVPELTQTGLRHDHIVFRGSYIEQQYLSHLWAEIHESPVVDIRRCYGKRSIACYLANYLAKSPAGRYSYSWGWVWKGFAQSWKRLKSFSKEMGWSYHRLLTFWRICVKVNLRVEEVIPI